LEKIAIAAGDGWTVEHVLCTFGPKDKPFEEQHDEVRIAMVLAGSFHYRAAIASPSGRRDSRVLMTPGSLLLGNAGQCYECSHEHGIGDRCLAFGFTPEYLERVGVGVAARDFRVPRVPPIRALSPLIARACAGLGVDKSWPWEELSLQLAARVAQLLNGDSAASAKTEAAPPNAEARVSRIVRAIDHHLDTNLTLANLARAAGLSPYHFLRTFTRLTGVTPHQYILRARLRAASTRLSREPTTKVIDIALDSGFRDLSNFTHAFRAEFGMSPRRYRSISHVSPTRS
jgi:AraC family transcriptional regulator